MPSVIIAAVSGLAGAVLGSGLGYLLREYLAKTRFRELHQESERLLNEARTKYREIELEAKDLALRLREEAEADNKRRRAELRVQEQRLQQRRESLDRRIDALEARERELQSREKGIEHKELQVEQLRVQVCVELEHVAGMDRQEARVLLLKSTEEETRQDLARVIRQVEAEVEEEAERRAREIISLAIQRFASDQVAETTVSSVPLPNDEMKGRIIGRGGRNIRAIESATGVDL
ncbi:MAG TPA: Rnase Y domain-containing protein, partial [Anaerolineae bacterium]|nr:Rnase Y domain-containing protein [Anaerolineae bacterium]